MINLRLKRHQLVANNTCIHSDVVQERVDPDGSIWGVCRNCGERDFPIKDVAYEAFLQAHAEELARLDAAHKNLPADKQMEERIRVLSAARDFWERKAKKLQARLDHSTPKNPDPISEREVNTLQALQGMLKLMRRMAETGEAFSDQLSEVCEAERALMAYSDVLRELQKL